MPITPGSLSNLWALFLGIPIVDIAIFELHHIQSCVVATVLLWLDQNAGTAGEHLFGTIMAVSPIAPKTLVCRDNVGLFGYYPAGLRAAYDHQTDNGLFHFQIIIVSSLHRAL